MNTKLKKKAAAWSLYQVLGLVMILSMVFAAPLAVLGESIDWTEPVPPDAPPGSTITIMGGNSDGAGYIQGETVFVDVVGPNGTASFFEGKNWCEAVVVDDPNSDFQIWECDIILADSPDAVGDYTYTATGQTSGYWETGAFQDAFPVSPGSIMLDPGDSVTFVASGGTEPYSYGFFQNQSNATIDPTTGVYVAGSDGIAGTDVVDIIEVTDAKNNKSYAYVFVGEFGFGQTINDVPCAVELSGFNDLNCTAQDVRIASVTNIAVLDDGCAYPGDTVKFRADYEVFTGATERYDIGLFFATDGDPDNSGAYTGTCSIATLPYGPPEFFNDLDGVQGGVQDTCGDVGTNYVNPVYHSITLTVVCVANPTTGNLELPYLVSWAQGGRDLCTSPLEALPGTKAKCSANNEYSIDIPVPGQIIVEKDTDGIMSPDFGFTLSEYIEGAWEEIDTFDLAGQDPPYESEFLYAGLYKVEETTIPSGWTPSDTAYKCVSDMYPTAIIDPIHIDLNPGETITCTFYNEQNTGTIIIEKESIFGAGTFDFTSPGLGDDSFMITTAWDAAKEKYLGSKTFSEVVTGTYVVTETGPTGWSLVDLKCDDSDSTVDLATKKATIKLAPDETVTCRFVNKKVLADLTVSKTVDKAGFTRTWEWGIDKEKDGTYHLFAGENVDHAYTVLLTPKSTDSAWYVEGKITVSNPNEGTPFKLISLIDTIPDGVCNLVGSPTLEVPAKVGATSGTLTVDYRCTFAAKPLYTGLTNTAEAKWDSAFYNTPTGTASGTKAVSFVPTTQVNDKIKVSDTNWDTTKDVDANDEKTWKIEYTGNFACPAYASGLYKDGYYTYDLTNTAAIVGTTPLISDTAKVTVNCYNPTVSKTADGTYDRTYKWAIDKSVDPTKINVLIGMEGTFNYTVKISSAGYTDDNFTVAGKITVVNPHPTEDIKVLVTDEIGTVACKVSGLDKDGYVLVKAKTSAILDYTCEDLTGKETQNDVEAAWTAYAGTDGEVTGTATAFKAITFNKDGEYLDTVTIYDDKTDPLNPVMLGTVSIKDTLPKSFTYMLKFVAVEGCMSYTNKAWIKETGQYDTATATICGVYWAWTPGFWRNHGPGAPHGKDAWQYTGYKTTDQLGSVFTLGEFTSLRIKGSTATFGSITLLDAVRLKGGTGDSGAAEILLRAGTASLLNASLHELLVAPNHPAAVAVDHDDDPLTPDVLMSCDPALLTCTNPVIYFPLTSQGVIDLVDAALAAADRSEMLALAAMLDYYNNGWEYFDWTWPVP